MMKDVTKPKRKKRGADTFDLSHLNAVPLKIAIPNPPYTLRLYLVGCGGTGSWLAPHLVRLARFLHETRQIKVEVHFLDPDKVEKKNIYRQNFGEAEVGGYKAELLALRYAAAWGECIHVHVGEFDKRIIRLEYGDLVVLIGCVDNAAARRAISETIETRVPGAGELPRVWWLDCGNGKDTGQVLFGAARTARQLQYAFPYWPDHGFCVNLPAPDLQHPELLREVEPVPQVPGAASGSCAEMLWMGDQSPSINALVANIAATYLWRLFGESQGLTTFATYCNLNVFGLRSRFITPEQVAQVLGMRPSRAFKQQNKSA